MKNNYISSSNLKGNVSSILHDAYYKGVTTVIKKYGKPIAKVSPYEEEGSTYSKLGDFYGSLPNFPEVTKERKFKRKIQSL